ncbi:unnamed protein product [Adineta ricciae]|uniref:Uncharacterized protein n=1 Tax=Adineta ricciae TaxID=249248 RepID=A0A815LTD5_ADIRI|nr:unnamed protein product [Adineta ricciae]
MIQLRLLSLFVLFQYSFANQCIYLIIKSDNTTDRCLNSNCSQFLDIKSLIVQPKICKTDQLSFAFSSYKTFVTFRHGLGWRLGDLFHSEFNSHVNRQLILYLNEINEDDQPFDYKELIHLGIYLDFYIIFVKNYSEWIMSKLKFRCLKFSGFDKYPCTSQILSPLRWISHQQSRFSTTEMISTTENIRKEIKSSTNFILFICLSLCSLFIIFIFIWKYLIHRRAILSEPSIEKVSSISTITIDRRESFNHHQSMVLETNSVEREQEFVLVSSTNCF